MSAKLRLGLVIGVLACMVSVVGAASAQQPQPAEQAQPPQASRVREPEVSDAMLAPPPGAPRELTSWDEALQLVRTHAPRYLSSLQRVQQAEARSRIALAGVLPVLTAEGKYTHQFFTQDLSLGARQVTVPVGGYNLGGRLRMPLVNVRAMRALDTGDRNERAAELASVDERRQIALQVMETMLATLATARVAELNRVGLRAALERAVLATTRQQYGRGTLLDVDRAQQDVAAARAALIEGDEALREAREALGMALGLEGAIAVSTSFDLDALEQAVARTCKLTAEVEQRPDVAAARLRLEVAERMVEDAELMWAPTLDLVSEVNHAQNVFSGPNATWNVQGVLSVPLYDGGARYGVARENRALAEQARQQLAELRLAAIVERTRATRAVETLTASRDVARQQLELARSIDQRIRQGYAGGLGTSLDLVTSAQSLREAENRLVLLELEVTRARANAVLANAECMY